MSLKNCEAGITFVKQTCMKGIYFVLFLLSFSSYAQLNCKNTVAANGDKVKTCYFKNKNISSVETWDKDNRSGKFEYFKLDGTKIHEFYLRKFGGHASVYPEYYPGGQIKKIEYSSAPDGGIQFYRESRSYDEQGNQVDFWKMDYPYEHLEVPFTVPVVDTIKPEKKPEVIICAIPYLTTLKIINSTQVNQQVQLKPRTNQWIQLKQKEVDIPVYFEKIVDTTLMAQRFLKSNEYYEPVILTKSKKFDYVLVEGKTIEEGTKITHVWIITEQKKKRKGRNKL